MAIVAEVPEADAMNYRTLPAQVVHTPFLQLLETAPIRE
jgi:hypothetical protein